MNKIERFHSASAAYRCKVGEQELHCGDTFRIRVNNHWNNVRIEMAGGRWYLVGLPMNAEDYDGAVAILNRGGAL